jgi:parallel beta-helix repeat protein
VEEQLLELRARLEALEQTQDSRFRVVDDRFVPESLEAGGGGLDVDPKANKAAHADLAGDSEKLGGQLPGFYRRKAFDSLVAVSDGDYTSIQAALNDGRRSIFVKNGVYNLTDDLTISSSNTSIVGESMSGVVLNFPPGKGIRAEGDTQWYETGTASVTVPEGIWGGNTIQGTGTSWSGNVSIGDFFSFARQGQWIPIVSVTDNEIALEYDYRGPTINNGGYTIGSFLVGLHISNLTIKALSGGAGIKLNYVKDSSISDCSVIGPDQGIQMYVVDTLHIDNNRLVGNGSGITGHYITNSDISHNGCLHCNNCGIELYWSSQSSIVANNCSFNKYCGIAMEACEEFTIAANVCKHNRFGFQGGVISVLQDNVYIGNILTNNQYGFRFGDVTTARWNYIGFNSVRESHEGWLRDDGTSSVGPDSGDAHYNVLNIH